MKFLFVTLLGESSPLAQILLEENHKVRFYIKYPCFIEIARGMVPRIHDCKKHIDWADVIVFDDADFGKESGKLRQRGYLVVGGNRFSDRLEDDRIFGQKVMLDAGMKIPFSRRFRSFANAIKFIREHPKRYLVKFNGQLARYLCYVGKSARGEDLIEILGHYQLTWPQNRKIDFILQEYIDGVEMAVGGFFNGKDFAYPILTFFEEKRFCAGGIGPFTNQMGTSMFYSKDGGKLFKETLLKMKPYLAKTNYRGFIEINNIVTEGGGVRS